MGALCFVLVLLFSVLRSTSFTINFGEEERELFASHLLSSWCLVTVTCNALGLFIRVSWVGLRCVIVVFLIILTFFKKKLQTCTRFPLNVTNECNYHDFKLVCVTSDSYIYP